MAGIPRTLGWGHHALSDKAREDFEEFIYFEFPSKMSDYVVRVQDFYEWKSLGTLKDKVRIGHGYFPHNSKVGVAGRNEKGECVSYISKLVPGTIYKIVEGKKEMEASVKRNHPFSFSL